MVPSLDIAQYLYSACRARNLSINNTKMQKLLYIAYGFGLYSSGSELFDEEPKYFPHGPVFTDVLDAYESIKLRHEPTDNVDLPKEAKKILDYTLEHFGKFNAKSLSDWSHREGSAWYNTKTFIPNVKYADKIPIPFIKEEFLTFFSKSTNSF
jgi:uncharacterized phage-associated protein